MDTVEGTQDWKDDTQDLYNIVQDDTTSRMCSRMTTPDTDHSRFHKDKDLMHRVLDTPVQYLLYTSRQQLCVMSCFNHKGLNEFLLHKQNLK